MKFYIVVMDVVNDITYSRKSVNIHVWSYDFYDMTLSTGKQRHDMINPFIRSICRVVAL